MSERKRPGREPGDAGPTPLVQRKARAGAGATTRSLPAVQRREADGLPRAAAGLPRVGGGATAPSASGWLDTRPFSLHVQQRADATAPAAQPAADTTAAAAGPAQPTAAAAPTERPTADVHAAAAHGISGAAQALPFQAQIQASFGPAHDVSGIRAHVGGPAADGAHAMGARAFATGTDVAFASAPDLHTAAHEAAHVVQQQHGVSLYGGVGQAGDPYERHADAVADRVVAGQSAADLLAPYAGATSTTASVQRKEADAASPASPHRGDAVAVAVERVELAAETLTLTLARGGSIDAAVAGLAQALDGLAGAVHRQQAPGDDDAARVRAVVARVEQLIQQVGARRHSAHPTLDRKARELQQRVGRVASAAAEPVREVNVARLRAHAEYSSEQLDGAAAALRGATGMEPTGVVAAQRQAQTWAGTMTDPDSAAASATAAAAGRAIEQQFDLVREVAPRVAEVAQPPRTYSTGSALTAMATALGASIEPRARAAAARQRATVAYQQWQLDAAKGALESAAEDEASLGAMGQRPSGYRKGLAHRLDALEADADRGQLDTGALEELNVDADEVALFRNAQVVISQCRQLEKVLGQLDGNDHVRGELREAATYTEALLAKFGKQKRRDLGQRQAAVAALRHDLAQWFQSRGFFELLGGLDADGGEHKGSAQRAIEHAQTSKTITAIVTTIVVTLVSMGIASVAAGLARAGVLAIGRGAATAATAATASGIVTDVALNTAAQKWIMHDPRRLSTLALINSAMVFAGKGVQSAMARIYRIDFRAAESLARFDVAVVHVAADAVMGAAVDYAGSRIMGEPAATPETVGDWLLAGATIGITRGLATRLSSVDGFLAKLHDHSFDLAYRRLSPHVAEAKALIAKVNAAPTPAHLAEVLDAFERLTAAQVSVADELLTSPDRRQAHAGQTMAREHNQQRGRVEGAVRDKVLDGAGLAPDANGGAHGGAVEVALAVDTADRVGLDVAHDVSDPSAPRATFGDGDRSVTVTQDRRTGAPAELGPATTPAERAARTRLIAAARRVVAARKVAVARELGGKDFIHTRDLQIGAGPQGALTQGMNPAAWTPLSLTERIILADDANPSVMHTQGDLRIGQSAEALKGPGLPTDATATPGADFMTSGELGDAALLGSLHAQASQVNGRAIGPVEQRPADRAAVDGWQVKEATVRRRVRLADGHELWVYADRVSDLTGAGVARADGLASATDAATLAAGQADHTILDGADPHLPQHLQSDGHVLVVPGNPTPDWNAEAAASRGNQVDLMGDLPRSKRAAFAAKVEAAKASGDPAQLAAVRAEISAAAHPGLAIPRNTAPGAAGDNPNVHLGVGRPKSVRRLPDGRYEVVFVDVVTGEAMAPRVYDQLIYGYGQTKAAYLEETFGPPGDDGMLEAVFYDDAKTQLAGLRLPGTGYMVKGAAATTGDAAPWVRASDREAWRRAIDPANVKAGDTLFDGRPLSRDSHGVSGGMEMGRDRAGRAQVMEDRTSWKLPGDEFELSLTGDKATWIDQVRRFVAEQLPAAPPDKIVVKPRSGLSGDLVYEIVVDGQPLGIWKVFHWDGNARSERAILRALHDAELTSIRAPRDRGALGAAEEGGQHVGQSVLMDKMPGTSLEDLGTELAATKGDARIDRLLKFQHALTRTARGLAELHARFTDMDSTPEGRRAGRAHDADYLVNTKLTRPEVVANLGGPANAAKIRAALMAGPYQRMLDADLPAAAYHGDAHLGNFKVDHWDPRTKEWQDLNTFDLGTMRYGFPGDVAQQIQDGSMPEGAVGDKAAAGADLGRLLGSIETLLPEGTLSAGEMAMVKRSAVAEYQNSYKVSLETRLEKMGRAKEHANAFAIDPIALEAVRLWSQVELEVAAAARSPKAVERIGKLLGIELDRVPAGTGDAP